MRLVIVVNLSAFNSLNLHLITDSQICILIVQIRSCEALCNRLD